MFANHVVGVDSSAEMLSACRAHPNIEYRQSAAETIPAEAESFDLITVAHAFHWFDQDAFLAEASRVLRTQCWLVIYTSGFTAEMKENAGFAAWFKDEYLTRYPAPPRNLSPIQHAQASRYGFALRGEDRFSDEIRMTVERFTDYQLSTTNVLANASDESAMFEAERWIRKSIRPFFDSEDERTFLFTGRIWFLQKEAG
jgi:SAM-dependent methyltransferase